MKPAQFLVLLIAGLIASFFGSAWFMDKVVLDPTIDQLESGSWCREAQERFNEIEECRVDIDCATSIEGFYHRYNERGYFKLAVEQCKREGVL